MDHSDSLCTKNILLTGGGSGMGQATALSLADRGANVLIAGRKIDALNSTISKSEVPDKITAKEADVTNRDSLNKLFTSFDQKFGELDILIHAAGINIAMRSMQELTPENWDHLIEINLTGSYNVTRLALERMRPRRKGLIILINSVAGRRSVPLGGIGYNASKFGMSGLGMGIAEEEKENGIRVSNLYPGEVNTPILDNRKAPPSAEHRESILQSEDVASVILTLCKLPDRVHIPELVIKPAKQSFV